MMNLWDWLKTAGIFVFIMICLAVFFDWMNYRDLQRRLREQNQLKMLDNLVQIEVSDALAPGEALLIAPVFFNLKGEIDPHKVASLTNLEEDLAP